MQVPNIQREDLGGRIAIALAAVCLTSFLYKMIKVRLRFYRLRRQGMPMPPWDPIFGNLRLMPGLARKCPSDALQSQSFALLSMEHPACKTASISISGHLCAQCSSLLPRLSPYRPARPIICPSRPISWPHSSTMTGGDNFFTTNGAEWKHDRDLFNHVFSMTATFGHVDYILEEAEVYVGILCELAQSGDTFSMDQLACNYMMDVIGNITLNTRFNYQTGHNPIAASMRDTIDLECGREGENNPFRRWNFYRLYRQWCNSRTMDRYIGLELEKRYQEWLQHDQTTTRGKSIMDIVIAEYMKTRPTSQTYNSTLDPEFKSWAVIQIRLFLFVGHDSTAVTIIYCLYLLSKHPETLAKIRLEHEQMFSSKTSVATQIKQHPEMINQMPYTHAVIKETLRLFPPANGLRFGRPGVSLTDTHSPDGRPFPVDGCAVWIVHTAIQRNTGYWPYPHKFIPDRWLVQPGHELYPPTGGWRPFERGARDCVGQNMAFLGIKITLAMVVREFDFDSQYEEWDRENPGTGAVRTMFGERAYLVAKGAAHPSQGYPCKVRLAA
ncbi:sterigmatocystin biosynthesis P450 monooxygenase stcS [Aspergillus nomiae NRRL 13137]|uniref:Sterigmatocystin biosynthesis P450 monooxygenase stcS n=1 Tax=Aspergillus nomiae NRRL (strain ATCC 15546 / NRRL 13137 / CBS 260.88 / M93) TaxID=1509407 RepID=A0A0L1IZ75_ASPN3|nr:sterigmatocystin biosynthesis P450 monooxygenase stcS [Aspergillus nomiae NRRL 13137]KNG84715.1 sterigmatocystin biosynthesis P450 monooxygenase stcS [Aspergillus nomiae NRRL 13137]